MIQEFVDRFMTQKPYLEAVFAKQHPTDYMDVVRAVVIALEVDDRPCMDKNRIHEIDDGSYQGTLVFVIAETGYQPCEYWYVKVGYGSCSGCDTLQMIRGYQDHPPTESQVKDYMTLALHVVQGLKRMADEYDYELGF